MKNLIAAALLTVTFWGLATAAEAAWLIDPERYHISVHGQLSCQDCHSAIGETDRHPDPADVNRSLTDFFKSDQCLVCHDDVADDIAAGRHADQTATIGQQFDTCIECHDPHYEFRQADDAAEPVLSRPLKDRCSLCHEFQAEIPEFSDPDQSCMQCHLGVAVGDPHAARNIADLCFHCHSIKNSHAQWYPLIDETRYAATPHKDVNCLTCHPQAARFRHRDQVPGDCSRCHLPHDEKLTHDLHAAVSCGACHLNGVVPLRDSASRHILWRRPGHPDGASPIHQMEVSRDKAFCIRCHTRGNTLGAAAMVLPAKSIICMPCHASTLSVGDTITVLSLVLFTAGMILIGSVWFSGGKARAGGGSKLAQPLREATAGLFASRIRAIIGALLLDGLLQRRLFKASKERWLLHALIFFPFLFRFIWGIWALTASLQWPQWPTAWAMLDKNNALTAFIFDLSGMMIIIGVIGMAISRVQKRSDATVPGLPATDWPAYALLGAIMTAGFILEGMRMAMTGSPDGAEYAFIGDGVSRLLAGFDLTGIYGYIWYLHAIFTGAFIVYLPFSRMLHMVTAPVVLAMKAAGDHRR